MPVLPEQEAHERISEIRGDSGSSERLHNNVDNSVPHIDLLLPAG